MDLFWYHYQQNNSGGTFDIDEKAGIGPRVWIEAPSADAADRRAEDIGLYFDGLEKGVDCPCCGDRWYPTSNHPEKHPLISREFDFNWHPIVYLHHHDGRVTSLTEDNAPEEWLHD
jgi:hypothetical protein